MRAAAPFPPSDVVLERRRVSTNGALIVASFGAFLAFLDATIVNVAFPSIRESFDGSSLGALSWVLNAYNVVFAAFLVAAGRFADVFGRRRLFTAGVVVFTIASAACALAPSLGVLIAARVLQAVGAAALVPASLALVVAAFPGERRAHAVAVWGATAALAAGLGPPIGGALVEAESWRLAFLINLPLGVAAVAAGRHFLVESRAPGRRVLPDTTGALLLAIGVALLTLAVVEAPDWGWLSPAVGGCLVVAVAAFLLFALSSRRHRAPVLDPTLLRIRSFAVANAVTLVASVGFYAYLLNNILWLFFVWDWSLLEAGLAVAPGALVAAVVAASLGRLADARGHRLVAVPGALVWAAAYAWYAWRVGDDPNLVAEWLPGQVLSGIGVGATLPVLAAAGLAAVPGARYATASAVVSSTRQLGAVLGVALLVVIVGAPTAATAADALRDGWLFSAGCFVATALGALLLRPEGRIDEAHADELTPIVEAQPPVLASAGAHADESAVLFRLPAETHAALLAAGAEVALPAGDWLFRAGDASDALYVLRTGRLEVVMDDDVVRELAPEAVVGELGVLTGAGRSASIRARRDSRLIRIANDDLQAALAADAGAQRALTTLLAEQLQRARVSDDVRPAPPRVVAVVGSDPGAPAAELGERLTAALADLVRVAAPGPIDAVALERVERDNDRVVLVAGAEDDEWRRFCLRQADRVVVVATAGTPPPSRLDRPCYVALTGTAPTPDQLDAWEDALAPRRIFITEPALTAPPLAARLAGRSVGVALGGGGARAFAGIGVIEELAAAGYEIDRISGCSVGAVVAALFATGRDAAAVDAACYEEFVRRNPFGDFTVPRFALSRGRRAEAALARQFGDVRFEELPKQLVVVSTDLLRRELVVHRRGSVAHALRASLSLPGIFPPARFGDSLHVDGGVLDNVPVAPLAETDEGPVVAVNIGSGGVARRGGQPRMPALTETLLRSMLIGGASALESARRLASVVVTPDTRGIGLLEFHQIDRAVEAGRQAGRAAVEALATRGEAP